MRLHAVNSYCHLCSYSSHQIVMSCFIFVILYFVFFHFSSVYSVRVCGPKQAYISGLNIKICNRFLLCLRPGEVVFAQISHQFWPSYAPGKGDCGGAKIFGSALLQPAHSVYISVSAFLIEGLGERTEYIDIFSFSAHRSIVF